MILSLIFLLKLQTSWADPQVSNRPDVLYVHYDQNFNVWRRIKTALKDKSETLDIEAIEQNGLDDVLMSSESRKPKKVLLVELDLDDSELASEFIEGEVITRITGPNGGRLIPVFKKDLIRYLNKGTVIGETQAYKLLGRSSWYLAPTVEGYGGVFLKKIQNIPLYQDKAGRALFMVDYLQSGLSFLPEDLQNIFVPEQMRVSVSTEAFRKDIFVFRSAEAIHSLDSTTRIFPLHGLLGTNITGEIQNLKPLAKLSGLSEKQWKHKYLYSELARITAYLHLVLGVSLENHTQNVLAEVDMQSGELKRLLLRDLGDGVMNPIVRLAWGGDLKVLNQSWSKSRFKNLAYHSWIEPTKTELAEIGFNTAVYTGQSLDSHGRTFRDRLDGNIEFINNYLAWAEKIIDSRISLSASARDVLESLKTARKTEDIIVLQTDTKRGRIDSAVAFIIEEIYQKSLDKLLSKKLSFGLQGQSTTSAKRRRFQKAIAENRVAYVNQEARNQLVSRFQKTWLGEKISGLLPGSHFFSGLPKDVKLVERSGKIWALDESGSPMAVEFIKLSDLTPKEIRSYETKEIIRNVPFKSSCSSYLIQ